MTSRVDQYQAMASTLSWLLKSSWNVDPQLWMAYSDDASFKDFKIVHLNHAALTFNEVNIKL